MGASNSTHNSMKFFVLKSKDGDIAIPFFGRKEKGEDGKWTTTEKFNEFTGKLVGLELGTYQWKNKPVETISFYMEDPDGSKNKIETGFSNGLVRNILNCLAAEESLDGQFLMRVYVNKSGYPAVHCEMNGKKMSWKYKTEEFPQPKKVQIGNLEGFDTVETDAFFKKLLTEELMTQLEPVAVREPAAGDAVMNTPPSDDLPF